MNTCEAWRHVHVCKLSHVLSCMYLYLLPWARHTKSIHCCMHEGWRGCTSGGGTHAPGKLSCCLTAGLIGTCKLWNPRIGGFTQKMRFRKLATSSTYTLCLQQPACKQPQYEISVESIFISARRYELQLPSTEHSQLERKQGNGKDPSSDSMEL